MRDLSATNLTANQKSLERPPRLKLELSTGGVLAATYDISSSTNRIISLNHIEQEWNQVAYIAVNSDPTLAALDLQGYKGYIYYGYNDAVAGDEYSYCAPLEVLAQSTPTDFRGSQVQLVTSFALGGVFNFMQVDKASKDYSLESDDARTVKTLLTQIVEADINLPFWHCKAYTITFDSEDSLIDTYLPADYFYVSKGEDRLSAFRKLLKTTKCQARIGNDGAIHVFNPKITGAYDYEYNDAVTNHNFFEKGVRERLVIPNRVYVQSAPSHTTKYYGNAVDTASYTALGRYIDSEIFYIRAISNTQCENIATAKLQHLQVDAERGHGFAPMNCGQEVMDYIKMTDSVASDERAGNIGYLQRRYVPGKRFDQEFRFGALPDAMELAIGVSEGELSGQQAFDLAMQAMYEIEAEKMREYVLQKLWVTKQLRIPEGLYDGD